MAAATQSGTIMRENWGSLKLHIIPFTNIDDTNTYASAITDSAIVGYWANCTDDATASTKNAIDVRLSGTTFTFSTGENARAATLYVLSGRTI